MGMKYFNYMDDIYFNSYESFVRTVDKNRETMLFADEELINGKVTDVEFESLVSLPYGRFRILIEGVAFECFFHYKEEMPLYVFFNGARTGTRGNKPIFHRWSYYPFLNGSMLAIADPMVCKYAELNLGWYYGDEEKNYREFLVKIALKIAELSCINLKDIIFVGSSGGGPAAIDCASRIKGSKAVVINSQIVLDECPYASKLRFEQITHITLKHDKWHRHNAIYQLVNQLDSTYIIIVNMRSEEDMQQLENICDAKNIRVKYGLNVFGNLIIWVYDGDMKMHQRAHAIQEYYCIWFAIEYLIQNIDDKQKLEDNSSFFRLIDEFWYEHWRQEATWRTRIKNVSKMLGNAGRKKEVGIFGVGNILKGLSKTFLEISGDNPFSIKFALDNDFEKRGSEFEGIPIKHPSDITDWKEKYIIITSYLYEEEIKRQLERYGLSYEVDFISYKDIYVR